MKVCREITKKIEEVFEETIESWITKVDRFCEDLPWPLDWFCHVVTTVIKVVETIVKTIVKTVVTVVCHVVAAVVAAVAAVVQVVLSIPVIGPIVKWFIGAVVWVWSLWVGLIDAGLGLIGIRPIKHLRLHVIILMREDRTLIVPVELLAPAVQRTESIFRARADVKIHSYIHQVDTPSPRDALTIETGVGLLGEDMTGAGLYFQTTITDMLWEDNPVFVTRVGAPIVAFIVDGVGTTQTGCSAGPLADYVCVEGTQMVVPVLAGVTLAHELGHACGLLHDNFVDCGNGDPTNLMYCNLSNGDNLSPFQRAIVRSSPHVTYI